MKVRPQPGEWCKLKNGWLVGPVIETVYDGLYVKFGEGAWQLELDDESSPRYVVSVQQNPGVFNG